MAKPVDENPPTAAEDEAQLRKLVAAVQRRAPLDAFALLDREPDETVAAVLARLPQAFATQVLLRFPEERQAAIVPEVSGELGEQWSLNLEFPEDSVGRLMSEPAGVFRPDTRVREAIEQIRELARTVYITYAYVTDEAEHLLGVVVMRDLMLAEPEETLADIMVPQPFAFRPDTPIDEAMRAVVHRHYPVYPVCDEQNRLIGLVPGYLLFEQHTFNLTAQSGRMVGVDEEEHYGTPWRRCFKWRHPWLQINLLTAFLAAAVVGGFEQTIAQVVALAVFLPVLAGQAGNTGVQALAVTVRGLTLGEFGQEAMRRLLAKEALLGAGNGALVGIPAAAAMYAYALMTGAPQAPLLALTVFLAMIGSCMTSGLAGVVVPLTLRRFGVDPAAASGIFVTTATDVASLGLFLGCATLLVL
ncbi:MAG TPA: magnesium transporter [Nevskiales bacterium]|nr:magnesium transporter [Nevskiales bacterium]